MKNAAQLVIFAVPLKGRLASLLEEGVPVLLLPELLVILWQEIHNNEQLCNKEHHFYFNNTGLNIALLIYPIHLDFSIAIMRNLNRIGGRVVISGA